MNPNPGWLRPNSVPTAVSHFDIQHILCSSTAHCHPDSIKGKLASPVAQMLHFANSSFHFGFGISASRVRNKASPRVNCPQNLARAYKMLRSRAKMALENVDSFQYLMYKCDRLQQKVPYGPWYKLLVWYEYHSVISMQQSFQVKRFMI